MKDHISVCVPTFRRPRSLRHLLRCLGAQETASKFDYSVVVVDNDAAEDLGRMVRQQSTELGLEITYAVGEVNTIPAARNHALRLARGNYIGIIDDDEFPPPNWLLALHRAIEAFSVDGALGPVIPFFETHPPEWIIRGRFCERPVHPTGTLLRWDQTRTGNVLLKRDVFDEHNLKFDESFTTGGSDREFFKHAMSFGCRFVAVAEAPVYETVPPERQTKTYWVRRALVNGFNAHRNSAGQIHGISKALLPLRLAAAAVVYSLAIPVCACLGTHTLVRCLERGGHHFSRCCAMLGVQLVKQRTF